MMRIRFQRVCLMLFVTAFVFGFFFSESRAEQDYPKLYGKLLPRYPNANVVSTGRQVSSLRDGLRIQLISSDPVKTVASYYEEKMKNLGWIVPKQRLPSDRMYMGRFTKDNLYYQLTIMRLNPDKDETRIDVVYAEH